MIRVVLLIFDCFLTTNLIVFIDLFYIVSKNTKVKIYTGCSIKKKYVVIN